MHLPELNANLIIIAALVALGLYGLMAGKQRLRILILSVYVGIVIAEQMAAAAAAHFKALDATQVSWALFGLPILLFGFFGITHSKSHDKGSAIANLIVGLLTGALIVASALHLMPTSVLAATDRDSVLATYLHQYQLWIVCLLPVVALILGFMKGEKHGH